MRTVYFIIEKNKKLNTKYYSLNKKEALEINDFLNKEKEKYQVLKCKMKDDDYLLLLENKYERAKEINATLEEKTTKNGDIYYKITDFSLNPAKLKFINLKNAKEFLKNNGYFLTFKGEELLKEIDIVNFFNKVLLLLEFDFNFKEKEAENYIILNYNLLLEKLAVIKKEKKNIDVENVKNELEKIPDLISFSVNI